MPSVPSHDRSLLQEAIDRAGNPAHRSSLHLVRYLSYSPHSPGKRFRLSSHFRKHSRARPYCAIHLPTWCAGQTGPPVCATRRLS